MLARPEHAQVKTPAGRTPVQCAKKYGHSQTELVLRQMCCQGLKERRPSTLASKNYMFYMFSRLKDLRAASLVHPRIRSVDAAGNFSIQKPHFTRRKRMSRILLVSVPFIFAAAEQLGQCLADTVNEEMEGLEADEALEFSLLQTSLSVSQRVEPRHAESLLSHVVASWQTSPPGRFSASHNMSSPLALVSSMYSRTSARDIIAWPGACVLSLSFAVTLIFASHASKAPSHQRYGRGAGIAGAPGMAHPVDGQAQGAQVRSDAVPNFGGLNAMGSSLRSRPAPTLCSYLSLMHGAAQFRIPMASMELLRAGFFPMQISGSSGKPLLHAWLPMCTRAPPGGGQACPYPGNPGADVKRKTEIGHLLQLTTTDTIARFPHASIGLLQAGALEQRLDIFGSKNEKYGTLYRASDKWLVHYHSDDGSEQLAMTLLHVPAAMGFCAYGADGRQVATATRIHSPSETLSISTMPGGDAMLALLSIMAIVLSGMETVATRKPAAPKAAVPQHSLPPGYADASGSASQSPSQVSQSLPALDLPTSQSLPPSLQSAASTALVLGQSPSQPAQARMSEARSVPTVLQRGPFFASNPNVPNFAARPSPQQ
eukprot:symbB.v1.2.008969.t1/scaffold508.1/size221222/18